MSTNPQLIQKCQNLRNEGFTLGEIMKVVNLPKTTIHYNIRNLNLSPKIKKCIRDRGLRNLKVATQKRKGKCWPSRKIVKPVQWTDDLLISVGHFMFDGEISYYHCTYHNRSKALISKVEHSMKKVFGLQGYRMFIKETGVYRSSYYNVELTSYLKDKGKELKNYIRTASLQKKRLFLRIFFDDEGCVNISEKKRLVRGYQHNLAILKLIQKLLKDFDIESKVDEKYQEIVISRKENLIKFRDKINFSKGVCINPNRKNSVWKQKLEKREILNKAINSYLT